MDIYLPAWGVEIFGGGLGGQNKHTEKRAVYALCMTQRYFYCTAMQTQLTKQR